MARRPNPRTPAVQYKGVTIRLYSRKDGWKATYQLHGKSRRERYGPTQAAAQRAAEASITHELDPRVAADAKDEEMARAVLDGVPLIEAAHAYVANREEPAKKATVAELRAIWMDSCPEEGYHNRRSLDDRSQHFENAFGDRQIASISKAEVFTWLTALKAQAGISTRTVRNIYDATKYMFQFARNSDYLIADRLSVVEQIKRPRVGRSPKEIFIPSVMQLLLDAGWGLASPGAIPLAITGFSAIRSEEIYTEDPKKTRESRLCWEDFEWKRNRICLRKETDKNKEGRVVPIRKNLREMLYPLRGKGPVYTDVRLDLEYAKIAARAGIVWKANAHRHSAITYDLLVSRNPSEVANRSGNSLAVIESNYRNRFATRSQANAWFKLLPRPKWGSKI